MISVVSLLLHFALIPSTLTVCAQGCDYSQPQSAVDAAPEGAVIIIKSGEYRSQAIQVAKSLTISGEGWPVLEGGGEMDVITVGAPGVTIEGLKVINSGTSYLRELAGIRLETSAHSIIRNNQLINNAYGVYLANSEDCVVEHNLIQGSYRSESESGNGIHSWSGQHHKILGNQISGHRDGIYLEFTNDSVITDNVVKQNVRYGLHFMTSHRNLYRQNSFEENGAGVAVMYSHDVRMLQNHFANNRGAAAYGLLLKDITVGEISGNTFDDNTYGIYMEGTNRSTFNKNAFTNNGYGLRIMGNCDDNSFEHNNFSSNTFDVATNSSRSPNLFKANYWSQYQGYDLDHNGLGDVPYRPVSLSSVIVEKLDASFVLIKSPLLSLLDQVEQAFPMLIPENLKDQAPLMQPWRDLE